jgi:hypothetical protein
MGIFRFFNRGNNSSGKLSLPENGSITPENTVGKTTETNENGRPENGITLLFVLLERNHEAKGYDDALVNPDTAHLEQNLQALKNEMERTIRKLKTYYEDLMMEIDFHIQSRSRSGMVDTVEELTMKKAIAESHIRKILEIETDAREGRGDTQGIIMSYTKGFKNGLAAISHNNILKRKL